MAALPEGKENLSAMPEELLTPRNSEPPRYPLAQSAALSSSNSFTYNHQQQPGKAYAAAAFSPLLTSSSASSGSSCSKDISLQTPSTSERSTDCDDGGVLRVIPRRKSAGASETWLTELSSLADQHKVGPGVSDSLVKNRKEAMALVIADPGSPQAWRRLLENEDRIREQLLAQGAETQGAGDGATPERAKWERSLLRLNEVAAKKLVSSSIHRKSVDYVYLLLRLAKGQQGVEEKRQIFKFMKSHRIGERVASRYMDQAHMELSAGDLEKAISVLEQGVRNFAEPISLLTEECKRLQALKKNGWKPEPPKPKESHASTVPNHLLQARQTKETSSTTNCTKGMAQAKAETGSKQTPGSKSEQATSFERTGRWTPADQAQSKGERAEQGQRQPLAKPKPDMRVARSQVPRPSAAPLSKATAGDFAASDASGALGEAATQGLPARGADRDPVRSNGLGKDGVLAGGRDASKMGPPKPATAGKPDEARVVEPLAKPGNVERARKGPGILLPKGATQTPSGGASSNEKAEHGSLGSRDAGPAVVEDGNRMPKGSAAKGPGQASQRKEGLAPVYRKCANGDVCTTSQERAASRSGTLDANAEPDSTRHQEQALSRELTGCNSRKATGQAQDIRAVPESSCSLKVEKLSVGPSRNTTAQERVQAPTEQTIPSCQALPKQQVHQQQQTLRLCAEPNSVHAARTTEQPEALPKASLQGQQRGSTQTACKKLLPAAASEPQDKSQEMRKPPHCLQSRVQQNAFPDAEHSGVPESSFSLQPQARKASSGESRGTFSQEGSISCGRSSHGDDMDVDSSELGSTGLQPGPREGEEDEAVSHALDDGMMTLAEGVEDRKASSDRVRTSLSGAKGVSRNNASRQQSFAGQQKENSGENGRCPSELLPLPRGNEGTHERSQAGMAEPAPLARASMKPGGPEPRQQVMGSQQDGSGKQQPSERTGSPLRVRQNQQLDTMQAEEDSLAALEKRTAAPEVKHSAETIQGQMTNPVEKAESVALLNPLSRVAQGESGGDLSGKTSPKDVHQASVPGREATGVTEAESESANKPAEKEPVAPIQHVEVPESSYSGQGEGTTSSAGTAPGKNSNRETEDFVYVNGIVYQKLQLVGRGGSSKVFKVISPQREIYALKRIRLSRADRETARGFLDEITLLKRLQGKTNIINLVDFEVNEQEKIIYMVLEYGEIDLATVLKNMKKKQANAGSQGSESTKASAVGALGENFLRLYWQSMLEAVHTIHGERIVHSDLKPANFMLVQGQLKLIDFGIARAIQNDTTNIMRDTQVGTLNYMSPEALVGNNNCPKGGEGSAHKDRGDTDSSSKGSESSAAAAVMDAAAGKIKVGRASDIWSLGCILFQMVYGDTPFAHLNVIAKLQAITDPSYVIDYPPLDNPDLLDTMSRCLDRNPVTRITIPELLEHPFLCPQARRRAMEAPEAKAVSQVSQSATGTQPSQSGEASSSGSAPMLDPIVMQNMLNMVGLLSAQGKLVDVLKVMAEAKSQLDSGKTPETLDLKAIVETFTTAAPQAQQGSATAGVKRSAGPPPAPPPPAKKLAPPPPPPPKGGLKKAHAITISKGSGGPKNAAAAKPAGQGDIAAAAAAAARRRAEGGGAAGRGRGRGGPRQVGQDGDDKPKFPGLKRAGARTPGGGGAGIGGLSANELELAIKKQQAKLRKVPKGDEDKGRKKGDGKDESKDKNDGPPWERHLKKGLSKWKRLRGDDTAGDDTGGDVTETWD